MVTDMKVDGLIINKMVEVTERVKDIGTMSYKDGDKYIGEWKNGKKEGTGRY